MFISHMTLRVRSNLSAQALMSNSPFFLVPSPQQKIYYRPHSRDGEGNVFTGVCPSTRGVPQSKDLSKVSGTMSFSRGYPSPRFFPRSLIPGPFPGSTPVLAGGCTLVQVPWGTPARTRLEYIPSHDRTLGIHQINKYNQTLNIKICAKKSLEWTKKGGRIFFFYNETKTSQF